MSDKTEPQLLSAEQLHDIERLDSAYASVENAIAAVRHRRALLADRAAYRQQVAAELQKLLVAEPTEAQIWDPSPAAAAKAWGEKERNAAVRAAATRLGIELPA